MAESTGEFYTQQLVSPVGGEIVYSDDSVRIPLEPNRVLVASVPSYGELSHFVRVSPKHGRSFEDGRVSDGVVFEDKNGVLFGTIGIKGADMTEIKIEEDQYSPFGYRVNGLKDEVGLNLIDAVSHSLRTQGLPTEATTRKWKLGYLIVDGEQISVADWKKKILNDLKRQNMPSEKLDKIQAYLKRTDFYVQERVAQVPERILDLMTSGNERQMRLVLRKVFSWLNAVGRVKDGQRWSYHSERSLDAENDEDILYFVSDWLPKQMGRYLAQFHSLGFSHGFASAHNWSLAATLYDLDSVQDVDLRPNSGNYPSLQLQDLIPTIVDLNNLLNANVRAFRRIGNPLPEFLQRYGQESPEAIYQQTITGLLGEYLCGRLEIGIKGAKDALIIEATETARDYTYVEVKKMIGQMTRESIRLTILDSFEYSVTHNFIEQLKNSFRRLGSGVVLPSSKQLGKELTAYLVSKPEIKQRFDQEAHQLSGKVLSIYQFEP